MTLEILVALFVSSHFSAATYISFDDAIPKSVQAGVGTIIPPQEFVWPSMATSLILITNVIVTLLFLMATVLIHIHCYRTRRMQSRVRASMIVHAVLIFIFGFIISPVVILDAAIPSSYFMLTDLPTCGVTVHVLFELPILIVMFFQLGYFFPRVSLLKAVHTKRIIRITRPVEPRS